MQPHEMPLPYQLSIDPKTLDHEWP